MTVLDAFENTVRFANRNSTKSNLSVIVLPGALKLCGATPQLCGHTELPDAWDMYFTTAGTARKEAPETRSLGSR